jgi:peptidoglycan/LPS O-acetylase OafA/YrhL
MSGAGFRADIEGLRAVAIAVVLLSHANLPFARGGYVGVDVFFVISGYLITGLLARELERSGTISLRQFYARRARRILPLAALVLIAVVGASAIVLSPVRQGIVAGDVAASATYVVNWLFATRALDYFADGAASPVQHYWSLAIEEQFYLVWPGLLLLVTWQLRRLGRDVRSALLATVVVVAVASFAYSAWFTPQMPNQAYFSTLTRAWELGLGAAIALLSVPRPPRPVAEILAWGGLASIAYATVSFGAHTEFPGTAALVPTLGAAALIVASACSPSALGRALSARPCRYVGRISYGWYLWHWPALIFAAEVIGPLSVAQSCLVVAAAWAPTALSHWIVEKPLHHSEAIRRRPRRAVALWSICTATALAGALALTAMIPSYPRARHVEGAAALVGKHPRLETTVSVIRPSPLDAAADRGPLAADSCFLDHQATRSPSCTYGHRSSSRAVLLFGDSHATQYFPPLERLAQDRGWRLIMLTKTACAPATVSLYSGMLGRDYTECDRWREQSLRRIETEERPKLVVVSSAPPGIYKPLSGRRELTGTAGEMQLKDGYIDTLRRLKATGARVAVIKDPAQPPQDIPSCVSESFQELDRCAFRLPGDYGDTFDAQASAAVRAVKLVKLTGALCPDGLCPAVIGGALVYRTRGHLTATFAATLAGELGRKLPAVG